MLLYSCLFSTCLLSISLVLSLFSIYGLINVLICILNIIVGCIIDISGVEVSSHVIGICSKMICLGQVMMFWNCFCLCILMRIGRLIAQLFLNLIAGMLLLVTILIECLYLVGFCCWCTILCMGWNLTLLGHCILLRYLYWRRIGRAFYSKSSFILNFT